MKSATPSRPDRLRHILAGFRVPGVLDAVDAILHGVDGGTLRALLVSRLVLQAKGQAAERKASLSSQLFPDGIRKQPHAHSGDVAMSVVLPGPERTEVTAGSLAYDPALSV